MASDQEQPGQGTPEYPRVTTMLTTKSARTLFRRFGVSLVRIESEVSQWSSDGLVIAGARTTFRLLLPGRRPYGWYLERVLAVAQRGEVSLAN